MVEQLGYHGIFFSESLMSGLDPFQVLAIAALRTKRIKLGTAIMTMTFREAVVLANQSATLNEISDGRAVLGLGTGDGTLGVLKWAREQITLGARDAGRDPEEIEYVGAGIVCVDENGDRARDKARGLCVQ